MGSATLFGVSMALGAFLAGMVVGRSEFSLRAAAEVLPMRDAFAVLFFVSVGMLFDPALPGRGAGPGGRDARHRPRGEIAGRAGHRGVAGLPAPGEPGGGRRPRADRRVLVHRGPARRPAAASCRRPPRTRSSRRRSCRSRSTRSSTGWSIRWPPGSAAPVDVAPGPGPAGAAAAPRAAPPGGGRRLRARRADGHAPLAGERHRADRRRAQPRDRAPAARGGAAGHLRRRQPPGHPERAPASPTPAASS